MDLKYHLLKSAACYKGQVRGRYAPSPSGEQHLGNIQTALVAWLQVRLAKGQFALRMDDIDTPRVKAGSAVQILDELHWLGLDWDEIDDIPYRADRESVYFQSRYTEFYQSAFATLSEAKKVYACACSRRQIERTVKQPNSAGQYIYPGTCRDKSNFEMQAFPQVAWRFITSASTINFTDEIAGEMMQNVSAAFGDFIVKRRNDLFSYHLSCVVDDINMGITDVVRGADLFDSTPSQIALIKSLSAAVPRYWHLPLKMNENGEKLAKRDGSNSVYQLRAAGKTAPQLIGQLSRDLGLTKTNQAISADNLLNELRIGLS